MYLNQNTHRNSFKFSFHLIHSYHTPIKSTNVVIHDEFVKITHFGATLKILRNFGHEITTLELSIDLSSTDVNDTVAKINII